MGRIKVKGLMVKQIQQFAGGAVLWSWFIVAALAAVNPTAEELYTRTDYQGSLALLDKHSNDPEVLNLIGRDFFMMGEFHKAADYFSKALAADPKSSNQA